MGLLPLQFVETNKELLSELPPPMAAAAYYRNEDLYMVTTAGALTCSSTFLAAALDSVCVAAMFHAFRSPHGNSHQPECHVPSTRMRSTPQKQGRACNGSQQQAGGSSILAAEHHPLAISCNPEACLLCLPAVMQFDALQTCSGPSATPRRPPCNTLLDVFVNIRCALRHDASIVVGMVELK